MDVAGVALLESGKGDRSSNVFPEKDLLLEEPDKVDAGSGVAIPRAFASFARR